MINVEDDPRVFRYSFWTVHFGLLGVLLAGAAGAVFSIVQALRLDIPALDLGIIMLIGASPLILLNLLADYLNRSRFATIRTTATGLEADRFDGERIVVDWNEIRRIDPIQIGSLDFIAARKRGGFRVVADRGCILVFRQIRGFDELVRVIRDAVRSNDISLPRGWGEQWPEQSSWGEQP